MKKLILCLALLLFLSGCAPSYRIENQAHAVSMGIDYEDDIMTVTVLVPNLASPVQKEENSSSSYQIYSASAENFETANNILHASLPQQLNLTHLKTIVFSKSFSKSDKFYETIDTFMNVFLITGSAEVIVTEKSAKVLIENQKPHIGIRLSITIPAMLSYHAQNGFIPSCTLSNLYAGLKGRYSTALCTLADTSGISDKGKDNDAYMPGELNRKGENKNEYLGAALFDRRRLAGVINGREMQMCYFLMGDSSRIADFASPYAMRVSTRKRRNVNVDVSGDEAYIEVTLFLDIATIDDEMDIKSIEKQMTEEFYNVISKCQSLSVEPFGFSEYAARKFKDSESFEEYLWLDKFAKADVKINLELNGEK